MDMEQALRQSSRHDALLDSNIVFAKRFVILQDAAISWEQVVNVYVLLLPCSCSDALLTRKT
jgi:hypothetical protein